MSVNGSDPTGPLPPMLTDLAQWAVDYWTRADNRTVTGVRMDVLPTGFAAPRRTMRLMPCYAAGEPDPDMAIEVTVPAQMIRGG